ncbi:hypothetical protein FRC03_001311 [Tulasnella sp. 419]|nr:hypothetical protein FRC02_005938 [Tulasnella sp. 418]KAG8946681.1 hypothetical protein FRC03_001311 [Tulasnella sp. 419]
MAGFSFSFNGYRRNQIFYATILILSVVACVASLMLQKFQDIPFSGSGNDQYDELVRVSQGALYSNIFLAIFVFFLFVADLFRSRAVPVWVELTWSGLAAAMQIANVVVVNQHPPTAHCASNNVALVKRDSPSDDVMTEYAKSEVNAEKLVMSASRQICVNWTLMCAFFVAVAVLLILHIGWLVIIGISNRASHPTFFWTSETPKPFTWSLGEAPLPSSDSASMSSESTFNPKKLPTQPSILPTHNEKTKTKEIQPKIGYYSFAEGKWI